MSRILAIILLTVYSGRVVPADPSDRGRTAINKYGCAVCHRIPGVASPGGGIGPSLYDVTHRTYIAGSVPNRRDTMARWIQHPQELRPGTVMPDLGVTSDEARDITAYLYSGD